MPPAIAVVNRICEEACFPLAQRPEAIQRIEDWRAFVRSQPASWSTATARDHLAIFADKLVELFPMAWNSTLILAPEPALLQDRVKTFMEFALPKTSQYDNLEMDILVDLIKRKKMLDLKTGPEPSVYYCRDPEMPAFWGKPVPTRLVAEAIANGTIVDDFGAGFVEMMGRMVAVSKDTKGEGFKPPIPAEMPKKMDEMSIGAGVGELPPVHDGSKQPGHPNASFVDPMARFGFVAVGPVHEDHQRLAESVLKTCGRLRLSLEAYVAREAKDMLPQTEFVEMMRLAKIGDAVVERYARDGLSKDALLKDDILEISCSAISTKILGIMTKNATGAAAMDVMAGDLGGLLGERELERAAKLAKEQYKLQQYTRSSSTPPWFEGSGRGRGRGRGDGGAPKGKGKGGKSGWLDCDVCHGPHVARYCPQVLNLIAKNSEHLKTNPNESDATGASGKKR